jgi:hypothetical protein
MIVIPMAGESRRFTTAGYDRPKYMLPLAGHPLFDWAVASFGAVFSTAPFLFIVRDAPQVLEFVHARAAALGIVDFQVAALDRATAGQAETVELGLALAAAPETAPLAIFNIDTIRPGIDPSPLPGMDGWLETFAAPGNNWSFIEPDSLEPALVARCTEKVRISDHCCTGLYQFATATLFAEALAAERRNPSSHELFVAPLYNHLIARGARIGWRAVENDLVVLSGVPAEYEALLAQLPPALEKLGTQLD